MDPLVYDIALICAAMGIFIPRSAWANLIVKLMDPLSTLVRDLVVARFSVLASRISARLRSAIRRSSSK